MFLENWKRLQMRLCYFWDLTGLEEEEVSCLSFYLLFVKKNVTQWLDMKK